MDHLYDFQGSRTVEVPYVCSKPYDGGNFSTYAERQGWILKNLHDGNLEDRSVESAAALLQEWMYFGVLHEVFAYVDVSYHPDDFVTRTETKHLITTKKLPELIMRWRDVESSHSDERKKQRFAAINSCLNNLTRLTFRFCGVGCLEHSTNPQQYPMSPEIALSVKVLADSLTTAGFQILDRPFNYDWGTSHLLKQKMGNLGWCPRQVATLVKGQQIHNLFSASTLAEPLAKRNHSSCNEAICQWEQIDETTYKTSHRPGCDVTECPFRGASINEIVEKIERKEIPVICFDRSRKKLSLKSNVGPGKPDYVAISHVCKCITNSCQDRKYS